MSLAAKFNDADKSEIYGEINRKLIRLQDKLTPLFEDVKHTLAERRNVTAWYENNGNDFILEKVSEQDLFAQADVESQFDVDTATLDDLDVQAYRAEFQTLLRKRPNPNMWSTISFQAKGEMLAYLEVVEHEGQNLVDRITGELEKDKTQLQHDKDMRFGNLSNLTNFYRGLYRAISDEDYGAFQRSFKFIDEFKLSDVKTLLSKPLFGNGTYLEAALKTFGTTPMAQAEAIGTILAPFDSEAEMMDIISGTITSMEDGEQREQLTRFTTECFAGYMPSANDDGTMIVNQDVIRTIYSSTDTPKFEIRDTSNRDLVELTDISADEVNALNTMVTEEAGLVDIGWGTFIKPDSVQSIYSNTDNSSLTIRDGGNNNIVDRDSDQKYVELFGGVKEAFLDMDDFIDAGSGTIINLSAVRNIYSSPNNSSITVRSKKDNANIIERKSESEDVKFTAQTEAIKEAVLEREEFIDAGKGTIVNADAIRNIYSSPEHTSLTIKASDGNTIIERENEESSAKVNGAFKEKLLEYPGFIDLGRGTFINATHTRSFTSDLDEQKLQLCDNQGDNILTRSGDKFEASDVPAIKEALLEYSEFLDIGRGTIVNVFEIRNAEFGDNGELYLTDNAGNKFLSREGEFINAEESVSVRDDISSFTHFADIGHGQIINLESIRNLQLDDKGANLSIMDRNGRNIIDEINLDANESQIVLGKIRDAVRARTLIDNMPNAESALSFASEITQRWEQAYRQAHRDQESAPIYKRLIAAGALMSFEEDPKELEASLIEELEVEDAEPQPLKPKDMNLQPLPF